LDIKHRGNTKAALPIRTNASNIELTPTDVLGLKIRMKIQLQKRKKQVTLKSIVINIKEIKHFYDPKNKGNNIFRLNKRRISLIALSF